MTETIQIILLLAILWVLLGGLGYATAVKRCHYTPCLKCFFWSLLYGPLVVVALFYEDC